jgi:hemoglobin
MISRRAFGSNQIASEGVPMRRTSISLAGLLLGIALLASAGCESMPWSQKKRDDSRSKSSPTSTSSASKKPARSLYDRLGGEAAIRAVVDDFVPRAASDEKVNFTRKGIPGHEWQATPENVAKLKERLVQFIGVATGGPQKYEGKDMVSAHKGMQITDAEFDALAADLKASLDQLNVPAQEQKDLLEAIGSTRGAIVEKP